MRLYPEGALVLKRIGDHTWAFDYPRLDQRVMATFYDGLQAWRAGYVADAEAIFQQLVADFPEFIDAHHHLALTLSVTDRATRAFELWQLAVTMGTQAFPPGFDMYEEELPWIVLENRPFLRALHALGLEHLKRKQMESAIEVFERLINLNPNDNQGARALLVDCYLEVGHPESVLEVCDDYPDDASEGILYGRPLALYRLGRKEEAEEALQQAIEWLPLIARYLVKKRHVKPAGVRKSMVTYGGADQAYHYWKDYGKYWKETPGAIEWVREILQKIEE